VVRRATSYWIPTRLKDARSLKGAQTLAEHAGGDSMQPFEDFLKWCRPAMTSRSTSGVQRSANISEARATGQNWPYPSIPRFWIKTLPSTTMNFVVVTRISALSSPKPEEQCGAKQWQRTFIRGVRYPA